MCVLPKNSWDYIPPAGCGLPGPKFANLLVLYSRLPATYSHLLYRIEPFVMPLTANFYCTFDLKLQSGCLVAPCIALNIGHKLFLLWAVVCFFGFFKWQPLLHSFFHFKTRASVCFACQYIATLLMVLGHTYTHSNRGQWYVCIFAFLLSFAFSCFGSLTCYYKDMKQYSHRTHTHMLPFCLLLVFYILLISHSINRRLQNTHTLSAVFDSLSAGLHWAYLVDIVKLLYPECCRR